MNQRTVITPEDAQQLAQVITGLPLPFTLSWREGGKRSIDQNSLLHRWYADIAKHYGDQTAIEVKAECHVAYGVTIRLRDPAFAWIWERTGKALPYEKQCAIFERGILAMTSAMTKAELTEYMDAMSANYRAQGVYLTDPELRKWEAGE